RAAPRCRVRRGLRPRPLHRAAPGGDERRPRAAPRGGAHGLALRDADSAGGRVSRVLVVGDEPGIRKVVRDALERAGHRVERAGDGDEAIPLLEAREFDLLVTDLAMPRRGGLDLVRAVRDGGAALPILVLTVRQEEREKVRLLDAGADDYVTKPFGTDELLARTRALLRRTDNRQGGPFLERWGDVEVDREARVVRKAGVTIHLTP